MPDPTDRSAGGTDDGTDGKESQPHATRDGGDTASDVESSDWRKDELTGDRGGISRRQYLGLGAAAVASTVAIDGALGASVTREGIAFDRVVDAVDDLGLDPNGRSPISDTLANVSSGTLVEFPDGTYQLDAHAIDVNTRVGFVGTGDVTWQFADGYRGEFVRAEVGHFLFENIDVDYSGSMEESGHFRLMITERAVVKDVHFIGRGFDTGYVFQVAATESDATVELRNVNAPHGANPGAYGTGNGRIGVYSGLSHRGILLIKDCEFSEFGNNGIYAQEVRGSVRVEDSYFLNNGISQIRISGASSWAKRCTMEIDMRKYDGPQTGDWGTWGFLCENLVSRKTTDQYPPREAGCTLEDSTILLKHINEGGVVGAGVKLANAARSLTVRNTDIHVDIEDGFGRSTHAVLRANPYGDWRGYRADLDVAPKPHSLILENVTITGDASGDAAVRIARGEDSRISDCCIQQTGANRDGIRVLGSDGSLVENTNVNVTGAALDVDSSAVSTSNLTYDESCPLPSETDNTTDDTTDTTEETTTDLPNVVTIEGQNTFAEYEVTVSEAIQKNPDVGTINDNDTISGTTATGTVNSGDDSYEFAGEITDFALDGDAVVVVNGTEVDPATLEPTSLPNTLAIEGQGEEANYEVTVSDAIENDPATGTFDDNDSISETTATGGVSYGTDGYGFAGEIMDFTIDGPATVLVNGTEVDPTTLGTTSLPNTLTIEGLGTRANYEVTVSEAIENNPAAGTFDDNDSISGTTATGTVGYGNDGYGFAGEITDFTLEGEARVLVNGTEVDPTTLGTTSLPNTLTIEGLETRANYEVTVSEAIENNPAAGTFDDNDSISGTTASGAVGYGTDGYGFAGEITDFTIDGPATVLVNGSEVDPVTLGRPPRTLRVEPSGTEATYEVTVSETIENDPRVGSDQTQTIDGTTATGTVSADADGYFFDGEITRFTLSGDATVFVDETEVNPDTLAASALPNVVVFDGVGSETAYEFAVTGDLAKSPDLGSVDAGDSLDAAAVSGTVTDETDGYRFSGDLTGLTVDGDMNIRFEDNDG